MREVIKKGNRYIRLPDNWHDERIKDIRVYFEERGYTTILIHRKDVAYIPDLLLYSNTEPKLKTTPLLLGSLWAIIPGVC